jgi:hypothetical protein
MPLLPPSRVLGVKVPQNGTAAWPWDSGSLWPEKTMVVAQTFFEGLYQGVGAGFIEIRPLLDSGDPLYGTPEGRKAEAGARRWFAWPKEVAACAQHCKNLSGRFHVYFGVGLRTRLGGGAKDDVGCVTAVFADVDFKDVPRDDAHRRIKAFPLSPSACVKSGNGVHVYWFLKDPVYRSGFGGLEAVNRGVLEFLSAQVGPQNADRILRVPETINIKAQYPPPKPVCEVSWWHSDYRYELGQFAFVNPKERDLFKVPPAVPRPAPKGSIDGDRLSACAGLLVPVWIPGCRHYFALHLGGWCAHAGFSFDTAQALVIEICRQAKDEEAWNRATAVADSYRKFVAGNAVTGRKSFFDFLSENYPPEVSARAAAFVAVLQGCLPKADVAERAECLDSPAQKIS